MSKKLHYTMGILFSLFISIHLFNHMVGLAGPEAHISVMETLRKVYRNVFVESLLLLIVLGQILSGINLVLKKWRESNDRWALLQIVTGLYLSIFLTIHVGAVLTGRFILHLDTNVYFAMAGLNTAGYRLFFFPYYSLAIFSIFGHVSAIHQFKMRYSILGLSPQRQSLLVLCAGVICTASILYAMTGGFNTAPFPTEYNVLVGK